jgi:hypothetical protein
VALTALLGWKGVPRKALLPGSIAAPVGNLVPLNRRQDLEADAPGPRHDVVRQGQDFVPAVAGRAAQHVIDDAANAAARLKHPMGLPPDVVEIRKECFVIGSMAELTSAGVAVETFQVMVGRMGQHEPDTVVRHRKLPGISPNTDLHRPVKGRRPRMVAIEPVVRQETG